jgi:hypothetical protein
MFLDESPTQLTQQRGENMANAIGKRKGANRRSKVFTRPGGGPPNMFRLPVTTFKNGGGNGHNNRPVSAPPWMCVKPPQFAPFFVT